jgi:plastocyanin
MSSSPSHNEESKGYTPHMRGVAWGILVMGISLAVIIILWATFGYIGPNFSTQVMEEQQEWLHERYGLPPVQELSPEMLQVPPSLRNLGQQGGGAGAAQTGETGSSNQTAGSSNQTAGSSNQTAGSSNQTAGSSNQTAGSSNQTAETAGAATGGGAVTLTILAGSSIQGSPDYDPDELTVAAGSEVTVTNDDTLPHTVTSGTGPTDPNSAQSFDTSLINGGESATLSLAQVAAGQYDYYCLVHPYMTGKLVVQ